MSVVKKSAKAGLYFLSLIVLLFVAVGIYAYVNMGSIAKQLTEEAGRHALGVPVTIGDMDVSIENKTIVAHNILVGNVDGYQREHMILVDRVSITVDTFSKNLLTFSSVNFDGAEVNLEVSPKGTNVGDLKKEIAERKAGKASDDKTVQSKYSTKNMNVIVKNFTMTGTLLNPSVTLMKEDLDPISIPDITVSGVGEAEGGLPAKDVIGRITRAVLMKITQSANTAGFLKGLSLETLNAIGVETLDVFKKNLKESYKSEVKELKDGFKALKNIFD